MVSSFLPKVTFIYLSGTLGSACWWYRIQLPKVHYALCGGSVVGLAEADIIHVARLGAATHLDTLKKLKDDGKKIIYDLDDDFWSLRSDVYDKAVPGYVDIVNNTASLCDAAIVTNQSLADQVTAMTGKPVYIVPNFLCT